MKSIKLILAAALLPLLLVSGGCGVRDVRNIENAAVATSSKGVALDNITKAIVRAGIALGWNMRVVKPGHIEATLYLRTHMAKVDVTYNNKDYSIKYKDSKNLDYDGTQIHSNYNGWVSNLSNGINAQLSGL
ncbi:MAG TPA: hypothetical protein ENI65_12065 [Gammaproteobacteria bacterium]|nr:hypothetical protein [Gammaproteobacteria bacterium]